MIGKIKDDSGEVLHQVYSRSTQLVSLALCIPLVVYMIYLPEGPFDLFHYDFNLALVSTISYILIITNWLKHHVYFGMGSSIMAIPSDKFSMVMIPIERIRSLNLKVKNKVRYLVADDIEKGSFTIQLPKFPSKSFEKIAEYCDYINSNKQLETKTVWEFKSSAHRVPVYLMLGVIALKAAPYISNAQNLNASTYDWQRIPKSKSLPKNTELRIPKIANVDLEVKIDQGYWIDLKDHPSFKVVMTKKNTPNATSNVARPCCNYRFNVVDNTKLQFRYVKNGMLYEYSPEFLYDVIKEKS